MIRTKTIYTCDSCDKKIEIEQDVSGFPIGWFQIQRNNQPHRFDVRQICENCLKNLTVNEIFDGRECISCGKPATTWRKGNPVCDNGECADRQ